MLLLPAPDRLKEWAYTGFAITLGSALIAYLSVGTTTVLFERVMGRDRQSVRVHPSTKAR